MDFAGIGSSALVEALAVIRPELVVRNEVESDADFLDHLFVGNFSLADILPHSVLIHQAAIRRRHFASATGPASRFIVVRAGQPIGRLAIDWSGEYGCQCADIALIPEAQNDGIGRALLQAWIAAAEKLGRATVLCVEPANPARRLYQRLGFVAQSSENGPSILMIRPLGG